MIQKKIGRFISLRMGIAMSAVMSFVGSTRGAITATNQALSHMPPEAPKPPFMALYMSNWLPSFLISVVISCIIAVGIGFIVPMKKVNDGVANITKAKGIVLRICQSFVTSLIYAPLIGLIMSFVAAALFIVPKSGAPFVPAALGNFAQAIIFEFIFAMIVSMILEPIVQKAAFKKYIPNYGQTVEGDDAV